MQTLLRGKILLLAIVLWSLAPPLGAASDSNGSDDDSATPVEVLARQDITRSGNWGKLFGTGIGAYVGSRTKLGAGNGAVIGGVAGEAAGRQVGKVAASRRRKFVIEGDSIERAIKSSKHAADAKSKEIARLRSDLKETKEEISKLQRERKENEDVSSAAASTLKDLNEQIQADSVQLKTYSNAIDYQTEVISTIRNQQHPTAEMESKRNELIAYRDELRQDYKALQGIDEGYRAQRTRVRPLTGGKTSHSEKSDPENPVSRALKLMPGVPNVFQ